MAVFGIGTLLAVDGPTILRLEFAGDRASFESALADAGESSAVVSIWLDYGFAVAYGLAATGGILALWRWSGRAGPGGWSVLAVVTPLAATAADVLENTAMLVVIGDPASPLVGAVPVLAGTKFGLLAVAAATAVWLVSRPGRAKNT